MITRAVNSKRLHRRSSEVQLNIVPGQAKDSRRDDEPVRPETEKQEIARNG